MTNVIRCSCCGWVPPGNVYPEVLKIGNTCPKCFAGKLERVTPQLPDPPNPRIPPGAPTVPGQGGRRPDGNDPLIFDLAQNKAYINVPVLMLLVDVDDTPQQRNLVTAPLAAAVQEWGYEPVLVGLDD